MARILLALLFAILLLPATAAAQCPVPLPVPQCEPEPEPEPTPPPDAPAERPPGGPPPPVSPVEGSATYAVDPGHTGYFADPTLVPPLERRWRRKMAVTGAPVFGQGRIYAGFDGALHALDPRTGTDVWSVPSGGAPRAYDAGRVFVTHGAALRAHSAADGAVLWSKTLSDYYSIDSHPVATGGMVYVGTPGGSSRVVALDAATGEERWSATGAGTENTPAVDDDGVYASYACGLNFAWNRVDGGARWRTTSGCSGGGGSTPTVYRGRLYVPENETIYDVASGQVLGKYEGGMPMFAGDVGLFPADDGRLRAVNLVTGRQLWKKAIGAIRPYTPRGPRIISGNTVFGLVDNRLIGLDVRTGSPVFTGSVPTNYDNSGSFLAAAPGLLLTVSAGSMTAWDNFFDPQPGGIEIGPRRGYVISGRRAYVGGLAGTEVRGRGRARLQVDVAPFGRWRRDAGGTIQPDGWIGFRVRVDRNVRVRVVAGGGRSNVATLYAYPRIQVRVARTGASSFRTTARLRYARRGRGLGGRRAFLYLWRDARRRYDRLAVTTVRATGPTGARAVFSHGVPTGVRAEDTVAVCVRGQWRVGLGQNAELVGRCGRRRIRF